MSIGIYYSSGFSEYLLFIQNSESELFQTDAYNALQCILFILKEKTHREEKSILDTTITYKTWTKMEDVSILSRNAVALIRHR